MYDNHTTERQQGIEPAQMQDNGDSDVIDVRAFLLVLWRRKWIIFNVALITIVMSAIVVFQLTPRYTAKAMLAIETRQNRVVDLEAVMSGLGTDQAAIKTEIDVLQSRRLVGKLVDDVNLVNDPEFNAELREGRGFLQAINPFTYLPDEWSAAIFGRRKAEQSPEEAAQATRARVVDQLLSQMTVANPPRSYTLEVAVESADPKKAAKIANGLANLYLTDQLEVKFEATERANEWLNERVFELREKVRLAEQEAQQFREENQLIQTQSAGLVNDQQLAQLNTQLVTARTDLARIEARERQIEQNIVDGTVEESGLLEVVQSPLIQRLKEQESEVRRRRAELATRYGPKHPRMMNVEAELADVRTKISLEIDKIVAGIRGEAEVAAIRVTTLEQNLEALKQESFKNSRAQVRMRELDREAEANRLLLQTFLTRFKETSSSDGMQQADARIISKADVPVYASFPKKRIIMVVAAVIGLGAGVALAFLMESLDNGYRSPEHLKQDLNLRPLGMIPLVGKAVLQSGGPEKYIISKPSSSFAEAHRSIHASLMFSGAGGATPKVLAVTSSIPGEGKSTATLCLAHILGRTGLKILVVEADMRRPVLRKRLGLEKGSFVSLNDVLSREPIPAGLSIYADDVSGIHVLWTDKEENPQKRFAAPEFQSFLSEARKQYDLVLIDTPPIMAVSDAMIIAKYAESIMFVVQWASTAKGIVKTAVKQLQQTGVPLAGAVLTQVDVKRHRGYGYGDQGYYYGGKSNYYTN
ncbi:GumC family protein [Kordiimonas gwangyangensis]|uniref:GumC family protein n=3 Tax=Kordiimonas gwangyangensis TaxID=288022 RepID=UPI00037F3AFA|nr:polysaccharide biosynthesis tyrosine autokinase [Kordiimonas gwangyangensis]